MKRTAYFDWIVYAAGGIYFLIFLTTATLRLVYPYEVEWNEGAVLDHAIRVLDGNAIYTAPSLDFSAFVYTPLYYYVTALAMKIGGIGLWAGRLVSILSTLFTAYLIGKIVQRESAFMDKRTSTLLAISGAMLYLGFYRLTGFFYDIVRMDSLALLLVVASIYVALYWKRGYLLSAILVALAYFTKQQMIFVWPALALTLALRDRSRAFWFALVSIGSILSGTMAFNWAAHGWYRFYTLTIPSLKACAGFSWLMALEFFPKWVVGALGFFTLVVLVAIVVRRMSDRPRGAISWRENWYVLLACYLVALASASLSLGNPGGYKNVFMPMALMVAILFPISVGIIAEAFRAWSENDRASLLARCLMFFAFLSLAYNPLGQKMLIASARQRHAGDQFIVALNALPGEVWLPYHGYISRLAGKTTHVHFMAMNDALVPHDTTSVRYQREIDSAFVSHRFSAIILDEDSVFHWDTVPHYTRAEAIFRTPNVFLSRIGDAPTRPQFIYLPAP